MNSVHKLNILAALLVVLLSTASCGGEDSPGPSVPAGLPPLQFERDPNSMEGLPGGALTYVLPSATSRPAGAFLTADDPLAVAFRAAAAAQRGVLTLQGRRLEETFAKDTRAVAIWNEALATLRVTRSRDKPDGTLEVVIQADLAPLFHHITGR